MRGKKNRIGAIEREEVKRERRKERMRCEEREKKGTENRRETEREK